MLSFIRGNKDFDAIFYQAVYADTGVTTAAEAYRHYLRHGRKEGRAANGEEYVRKLEVILGSLPADFEDDRYRKLNPDVDSHYRFAKGPSIHYLLYGRSEGRDYTETKPKTRRYDAHLLNLMVNRVFDLPSVVVDPSAPKRVNVLVPAFEFKTMSAGFFGVFQVARMISGRNLRVRLVLFDNFYWNYEEFKGNISGYPGMERIHEELEIEYIGERLAPLTVSPDDRCVATVWYSAYFADKIMSTIGNAAPFLYLVQGYGTNFFPGSTLFSLADQSYEMNYSALFSTDVLMRTFVEKGIGAFARGKVKATFFENACAARLAAKDEFAKRDRSKLRLAFYSRPEVNRNMFELGALSLCKAVESGVFGENWEFYGVGMGDVEIILSENVSLKQLPRMNLKEYLEVISSFDIGLSLMASPHPSLLPFDLAGSGAVVVTNVFGLKTQDYFNRYSTNIIAQTPSVPGIVEGLREAVARSANIDARYDAAAKMKFPSTWEETFGPDHHAFIDNWAH